jgi:Flp pilus assembly protein TadD
MNPLAGLTPRPGIGAAVLVIAATAAYLNSFGVPFLFDDYPSIVENPTIRQLWSPDAFSPPVGNGYTVGGRPVLNFTLAINYAVSGTEVWSYHAFNLVIHALAGLTLFGLLRRTFERLGTAPQTDWVPLTVALLWVLLPLQTQSVTYIVQRAESLVSLFYLLVLYGFVRGVTSAASRWLVFSVAACLLGMMTKEVMVTAPLVVLLYDRTFVAGSLRAAWSARRIYYRTLFSTWIVLALLVHSTGGRGGSVGGNEGITAWSYGLTQVAAVIHYLRLVFWPDPLIFDYGTDVVRGIGAVWAQMLLLGALGAAVVVALWRRNAAGFLGASFFLLLAPSSSFVPITTQTISEHRMYLALAPVLVWGAFGLQRWFGSKAGYVMAALSLVAGGLTIRRNADYRSEFAIWQDTMAKRPGNARAQAAHGKNLMLAGRYAEALPALERAMRFAPVEDADTRFNLALTLERLNRPREALRHFEVVARLRPDDAEAWNHVGLCQASLGRPNEATAAFRESLRLRPDQGAVHYQLGEIWFGQKNFPAAAASYGEAVRLNPTDAGFHHYHGLALALSGRTSEAVAEFEQALRLRPDYAEASQALAQARSELSRKGSR